MQEERQEQGGGPELSQEEAQPDCGASVTDRQDIRIFKKDIRTVPLSSNLVKGLIIITP